MAIKSIQLNASELQNIQCALNEISKQLSIDSLELNPELVFNFCLADRDGNIALTRFDHDKLEEVLDWIRTQLQLQEDEFSLAVTKKDECYIQVDSQIKEKVIAFINEHHRQSQTLALSNIDSKLDFFIMDTHQTTNLSHKGFALMLDYYAQKAGGPIDAFIINDDSLVDCLNAFKEVGDGVSRVYLVHSYGIHWFALKLEKFEGTVHIIEMDSLGDEFGLKLPITQSPIYRAVKKSNLKDELVHLFRAKNQRQYDSNNCGLFALKDAHKLLSKETLQEVKQWRVSTNKVDNMLCHRYLTPLRFMKTVQSRKAIHAYVKGAPVETKEQEVLSISFEKKRENNNTSIRPPEEDTDTNTTILYFKDKYIQGIVKPMLNAYSLEVLHNKISRFDGSSIDDEQKKEGSSNRHARVSMNKAIL